MDLLNELLAAATATTETGDARIAALRQLIGAADGDTDLEALINAALDAFGEIHNADTVPSDDDLATMDALADIASAARAEVDGQAETANAQRERAAQLASRMAGVAGTPAEEESDDGDDIDAQTATAETPEPALVAAAGRPPGVALARAGTRQALARRVAASATVEGTYTVHAAADIPDTAAGARLDGLDGISSAVSGRMQSLSRLGSGARVQSGIATIRRQTRDDLIVTTDADWMALDRAANERNLPGGSLVAAGGWCSPSETLYDFCEGASTDGMVDLPQVTIRRGGLKWPNTPDFASIYTGTCFFHQTEQDAINGEVKPCCEIPCPDFSECRLDVAGVCVRAPILTDRAWPELTRWFINETLKAHAHKLNSLYLAQMAALSTPMPIANAGPGATASVLSSIELAVEWLRYKRRMPLSQTMEIVYPHWLNGILRSDLSKRANGCGDCLAVSDAQLRGWMGTRGANAQAVVGWQDAFSGAATDFGGAIPPTAWPDTVDILVYPAGTFFLGHSEVITLDGVFDTDGLQHNTYTALFTEEAFCVSKRCFEAVRLTIPVCPDGATGNQRAFTCPGV